MTMTLGKLPSASPTLVALVLVGAVSVAGCGKLTPPFRDGGTRPPPARDGGPRDTSGADAVFDHTGIASGCAACHDSNQPYAAVPMGHRATGGLDCGSCHSAASGTGSLSWVGARFHALGSSSPTTCLPCHEAEAPTSTAGWLGTTYTRSPFDYGRNSLGIRHGGGQDCGVCHTGPGTGAWGNEPNWVGGHFLHGPLTLAETTCIACHVSQRPDLQPGATAGSAAALVGFDHALHSTVDCIGCHWATVAAETYVDYFNPATLTLPGGDWKGGQSYPGSTPVGFPGERLELVATTLTFSAAQDFVTSATVGFEEVRDLMIHTAVPVPAEVRAGPADAPDYGKCWHCHVNRKGVVTMYPRGKFHLALEQYRVTPDASVTPLPQPTAGCQECHAATLPAGLVGRWSLRPMQHGIDFAAPAVVAGVAATGVRGLDCSVCHHEPLGLFSEGAFHTATVPATPKDCVSCHYLTMADGPTADTQSGTAYQMRHTSAQLTFHTCTTCHPSAQASATNGAVAAESWKPGYYHAALATQPTACNDCHAVSLPAASLATFDHGAFAIGPGLWDCGDCHAFPGTGTATTPNWLGATSPPY